MVGPAGRDRGRAPPTGEDVPWSGEVGRGGAAAPRVEGEGGRSSGAVLELDLRLYLDSKTGMPLGAGGGRVGASGAGWGRSAGVAGC